MNMQRMLPPFQKLKVRPRSYFDVAFEVIITSALALVCALLAYNDNQVMALLTGAATVIAFLVLNVWPVIARPLTQSQLDDLIEHITSVVCDDLYARNDNPLSNGGQLEISIYYTGWFTGPSIWCNVQLPSHRTIDNLLIAKEAISSHVPMRRVRSTSRLLTSYSHSSFLQAPSAHDRMEACARRVTNEST